MKLMRNKSSRFRSGGRNGLVKVFANATGVVKREAGKTGGKKTVSDENSCRTRKRKTDIRPTSQAAVSRLNIEVERDRNDPNT